MADCTGLENRRGVKPTVGSNPTLSAFNKDLSRIGSGPCFVDRFRFPISDLVEGHARNR